MTAKGLALIGETHNQEELPLDFSNWEEGKMLTFLRDHLSSSQPFPLDELRSWQGGGMTGPYRWPITQQVVELMLDVLPQQLCDTAFGKPKLAPLVPPEWSRWRGLLCPGARLCRSLSPSLD